MSLKTRMKITRKKIVSIVLSAALLITMMPASISAAEEDNTVVEITEFTGDTTLTLDSQFNKYLQIVLHTPKGSSYISEEDQEKIRAGLDGSTLKLESITIKLNVSGTVATPFTPYAYIDGWDWCYIDGYNDSCTQNELTISEPGDYEIVTTIDSAANISSAIFLDGASNGNVDPITVGIESVATDNPDVVVKVTGMTVVKSVYKGADLSTLNTKIVEAKELLDNASVMVGNTSKLNYTRSTWVELSSAHSYATYKINGASTQDEVDAATERLTAAINGLISTKELNDALVQALTYKEADYTEDSWAALTTAVANANAISDNADEAKVTELTKGVTDAITALELKPADPVDLTLPLKDTISAYRGRTEESYTPETWVPFQTARDNAQAVVDNPPADLTEERVNELIEALKTAAKAMVPADTTAAKAELQKVIDQILAKNYQEADYTADSWKTFSDALKNAQGYVSSESQTLVGYVNEAKDNLQKAADNLKEVDKVVKEDGVYLDYSGSWIKQGANNGMTGYAADGSSAKVSTSDWWMDITGLDLSGLENPTLEVEYAANGDTVQIAYNTTGVSGWNDNNPVLTSGTEASGTYKTSLADKKDMKYLLLTSNGGTLEYTRVKIYDDKAGAITEAKKELDAVVSSAGKLNKADYTAESWAVLEKALEAAKKITEASTAEEINAAKKALSDAVAGLKKADTSNTQNNTGNNGSQNNGQNNNQNTTLAKGAVFTAGQLKYKVTNATSVAVQAPKSKTAKSITIPATVKKNGKTYKVTSIAANAFKNCKKLKKITIGKNVTSIGKNAFSNAKVLKKITVKSTKLKTVGKNALKGIHKKAVVKVPKAKLKKYKKLFKKKGQKKTVKISK